MAKWEDQERLMDEAIAKFPAEFGLRGHEGTFRISRRSSYFSGDTLYLYTERKDVVGRWFDFAKGTVGELLREVVRKNPGDRFPSLTPSEVRAISALLKALGMTLPKVGYQIKLPTGSWLTHDKNGYFIVPTGKCNGDKYCSKSSIDPETAQCAACGGFVDI
jgi:hypothetical protein